MPIVVVLGRASHPGCKCQGGRLGHRAEKWLFSRVMISSVETRQPQKLEILGDAMIGLLSLVLGFDGTRQNNMDCCVTHAHVV